VTERLREDGRWTGLQWGILRGDGMATHEEQKACYAGRQRRASSDHCVHGFHFDTGTAVHTLSAVASTSG